MKSPAIEIQAEVITATGRSTSELREIIREENTKARAAARKGLDHVRACGIALIELKETSMHGSFIHELRTLRIERRTASNYMRVAREWETVSHLNGGVKDALKLISAMDKAPSTKEEPSTPRSPRQSPASAVIDVETVETPAAPETPDELFQRGLDSLEASMPKQEFIELLESSISDEKRPRDAFLEIVHLLPELEQDQFKKLIEIINSRWIR